MSTDIQKERAGRVKLLDSINLGSPVAELDSLLYEARIETSTFTNLFKDKIDLVPGTKGSGKTALYRMISEFQRQIMLKTRVVILTGVEATGDPVFQAFKKHFESLTELQFENFWRVYFVALILERFVNNRKYAALFKDAEHEVREFKEKCHAARIPSLDKPRTFRNIVQAVLRSIKIRFGNATQKEGGIEYSLVEIQPEKGETRDSPSSQEAPMFLNELHDAIVEVLQCCGVKVWIMLDRLDEVFPRRTNLERIALRSLLRTTRNFPTDQIRIKIFLRDDIFENILLGDEGFTALSHIEARKAPTLKWGPDEIQLLIVKRFAANTRFRTFCYVDKGRISRNDMDHAKEIFGEIFPPQIIPGKNQSATLDWIYHHCSDGRAVVTPRDVIDLLEYALKAEADYLTRGATTATKYLISAVALKEAFVELSKKKCRTYLQAEFPEFWPDIKKFENSKAEHNGSSLSELLGDEWSTKMEDLVAIGFLQQRPPKDSYIIPFIFRGGMGIRQGKAF